MQAQHLSREVEQVTGEKAQAEQQVGELRAVQGQLELEVARLQHQLQGLEGQLQVSTMLQGQCVLWHMQLMCSCLFGQSTRLCLSCCSVLHILRTALRFAYEVDEPVCSHTRLLCNDIMQSGRQHYYCKMPANAVLTRCLHWC